MRAMHALEENTEAVSSTAEKLDSMVDELVAGSGRLRAMNDAVRPPSPSRPD